MIAISGAHGFIGSHLSEALSKLGHKVLPISRELLYQPNELEAWFLKEKPEYIFHLAAYGNMSNQTDVAMIVFSNLIGTANMLMASRKVPFKKFINFGSSSEYGQKDTPRKETDLPEAYTFYGASKVGATYLANAFGQFDNKPITTVRPFSVYGPKEASFRFIPTISRSLSEGKTIKLASGKHDWIFISDFIEALLMITFSDNEYFVYNIGTGVETTNNEVVSLLEKVSGKKAIIEYTDPIRTDDKTGSWVADISRLGGWKPKHTLEEGLLDTYKYYEKR